MGWEVVDLQDPSIQPHPVIFRQFPGVVPEEHPWRARRSKRFPVDSSSGEAAAGAAAPPHTHSLAEVHGFSSSEQYPMPATGALDVGNGVGGAEGMSIGEGVGGGVTGAFVGGDVTGGGVAAGAQLF